MPIPTIHLVKDVRTCIFEFDIDMGVGKPPFLVHNGRHVKIVRSKHVAALEVRHEHTKLDFENSAAEV